MVGPLHLRNLRSAVDRVLGREGEIPAPITFYPDLVVFVSLVSVVSVVAAAAAWRPITDPVTLGLGAIVAALLSATAVRTIGGVTVVWSSSVFVHLTLSLVFGPPGALAAALGAGVGEAAFVAGHWFKKLFNVASFALTNLSAYAVASWVAGRLTGPVGAALTGSAAGVMAGLANCLLFAIVVWLASGHEVPLGRALQRGLAGLPYNLAYGWAAYGAVLLYRAAGTVGFTTLLVPVLAGQVFLVLLARQTDLQSRDVARAEEAERRRIARDLHDSVVQVVAGWSLRLAADAPISPDEKASASADLRQAGADLRTLIIEIAPSRSDNDLATSLSALLDSVTTGGPTLEVDVAHDINVTRDERQLVLRVAQEAVRNAIRHADASTITVRVGSDRDATILSVVDDGRGFRRSDLAHRERDGHIGLRGLHEVAAAARARLSIDSQPGKGTTVRLTLP